MKQILKYLFCAFFIVLYGCSRNIQTVTTPVETPVQENGTSDSDIYTQYSLISSDPEILFATQLKASYTLVLGRYSRKEALPLMEEDGEITNYYFSVAQVLRGTFEEEELAVSISEDVLRCTNLTEGRLYVIPVGYTKNIFHPEKKYTVSCFIIPVKEDGTIEPFHFAPVPLYVKTDYPFHSIDELISYCSTIVDLSTNGPIIGCPYTLSEDIDIIIKEAPCVFVGYFSDFYDEFHNKNWSVPFHVTSILKGTISSNAYIDNSSEGHSVFGIFPAYEVENAIENKLYILVGSFSSSEHPSCMVFARKNAVIPLTDTDRVQQVYDALGIQPEP